MEGMVKGPLEAGKGVILGAGSLVKNTVSGVMNSMSKMTGSMSTGLSALTFDDEFMEERQKLKNEKPSHLLQGDGQGVKAIGIGVFNGITGVFSKPF